MSNFDRHNLQRLRRYSGRLNRLMQEGVLEGMPERKRSRLVGKIRGLYESLLGVVPEATLRGILAAGAVLVLGLSACGPGPSGGDVSFGLPVENPYGFSTDAYVVFPAFADIDGDGDQDLFTVGEAGLLFHENTGSPVSPSFAAPVTNPFGIAPIDYLLPSFADIDGDGDMDLLHMGYGYDGMGLEFYENTGTATSPAFAAPVVGAFGVTDLDVEPFIVVADLDGDGDMDVLANTYDYYGDTGPVFLENTGTATSPAFAALAVNTFGIGDLPEYSNRVMAAGDVDGDGDLDIITGGRGRYDYSSYTYSDAGFYYLENVGSRSAPSFRAPRLNPMGLTALDSESTYPTLVDLDADGDMDLVAGTYGGYDFDTFSYLPAGLFYFENRTL
ncbi:MAG: VCBS repeat-containing protein [Deltaproteobacteria bacterium]|nr:VCBS repeat-containing protein [Deltaproteobacteria bacterium]